MASSNLRKIIPYNNVPKFFFVIGYVSKIYNKNCDLKYVKYLYLNIIFNFVINYTSD